MNEHAVVQPAAQTTRKISTPNAQYIGELIDELTSNDIRERHQARERLARMGEAAVPFLIKALDRRNEELRWEAAKTLDEIASPLAIPAWIKASEDENCDIRWLAGQGLIDLGETALVPLLHALERHSDSAWFRECAHRVLIKLARGELAQIILPVLVALEDIDPAVEVPPAAYAALVALAEPGQS